MQASMYVSCNMPLTLIARHARLTLERKPPSDCYSNGGPNNACKQVGDPERGVILMQRLPESDLSANCDRCPRMKRGACQLCGDYVCGVCSEDGTPMVDGSVVCRSCLYW